LKASA